MVERKTVKRTPIDKASDATTVEDNQDGPGPTTENTTEHEVEGQESEGSEEAAETEQAGTDEAPAREERQQARSDDVKTVQVEIQKSGHQHRGVAVEKGAVIDVSEGAADRLVEKKVGKIVQ